SLVVALGGGIFWLGKKMGAKNKASQTKIYQQRVKLEKELQELNEQLQNENDPTKKQELEQKAKAIEQQIQNLGHNSPNPPINPGGNGQQPPVNNNKTHRQITVKYNTEIGDNQYNFSFYEEDATEKRGNGFIFDENNDNFQLIPINTAPSPSKNPSNDPNSVRIEEEEIKIEYSFYNDEYIKFNNFLIPMGDLSNPMHIFISRNNPVWGWRNLDQTNLRKTPNFKISFSPKDASKYKDWRGTSARVQEYYFDKNNNNFTLTPLGN
ncbi:30436_t:CDS:2, partial [Racocetra persica]